MSHWASIFFMEERSRRIPFRKNPRLAWKWHVSWLVRVLTRSRLCGVAVAYDKHVMTLDMRGPRFYETTKFLRCASQSGVVAWAPIAIAKPVNFAAVPTHRRSIVKSIARYVLRGRIRSGDCVDEAVFLLNLAGTQPQIPRWVCSPQQLHDWMESNYGVTDWGFLGPGEGGY